jgi:hypothetical protein
MCQAVAAKDAAKCAAAGKGRGECEKNYKLMTALLGGDRSALPKEPGMAAFGQLLLGQNTDCEQVFVGEIRRRFTAAPK